jgi:hypothetical protein
MWVSDFSKGADGVMSFLMGKYLKANRSVDGLRNERRRLVLPTGRVRLNFGLLEKGALSPQFFSDLRSPTRTSERSSGGGILS